MNSEILGWVSFASWSFSFWPQPILNAKRKSVSGLSLDFIVLNCLGFFSYFIFNLALFYVPLAQEQYKNRFNQSPEIYVSDIAFSLHAFLLTGLTLIQVWIYRRTSEPPSFLLYSYFSLSLLVLIGAAALSFFKLILLLDVLYLLSIIKMGVTLIKYIPQAILNQQLKSTRGWSTINIVLDLIGGVFSLMQIFVD